MASLQDQLTEWANLKKDPDSRHLHTSIMNWASANGYVEVLSYFKKNNPIRARFGYDADAINFASANGRVAVLDWWKNSGLEIKYLPEFRNLSKKREITDWWERNSTVVYRDCRITNATDAECVICYDSFDGKAFRLSCGHLYHRECIDAWKKNNCPFCRGVIYRDGIIHSTPKI